MRRPRPPGRPTATLVLALGTLAPLLCGQEEAAAPRLLRAVPFPEVRIADAFFAPRRATNLAVTLDHALNQLEAVGTLPNYDLAAAGKHEGYRGPVYQDSDAYKALEAVACALAQDRDPALEARLDAIIARMAAAQQPDGYLDTSYIVEAKRPRFTNLRDDHELYCAGHLFEAAVAHFRATRKRNLLDVAIRCADLLVRTFGDGEGTLRGYGGHPEIELALVKLAAVTNDANYLDLAASFVRRRGSGWFAKEHGRDPATTDGSYWLDRVPVAAMQQVEGHAVRAAYLMAGATDVGALLGDQALLDASRRVWHNTIDRNVFVTGGIGPSAQNEGFTTDYDLPTFTAYQESCASIALVLWAHRLGLVTRDPAYADAIETALYNAVAAGVQLDGTRFFYSNPLASRGDRHRREWFGCACCPPNLARTLAALGGYAYAKTDDELFVNLWLRGELRTLLGTGHLGLSVETDYPWQGEIALRVVEAPSAPVTLHLRVPAWCEGATLRGPGDAEPHAVPAGYAELRREFRRGDVVQLSLPMPVRRLVADPRAEALRGRVAFARGPIVYCAEQVDQGVPVEELVAAPGAVLAPEMRGDLLGGVTVLRGDLRRGARGVWPESGGLYRAEPAAEPVAAMLVPYAVWDNRAPGAMAVWLPESAPPARVGGPELAATIELSFRNANCFPEGLRDGIVPAHSGDTPAENCHFWPHLGGEEWAVYRWATPQRLAGCRVFWFDDSGHGNCRLPKSARLEYLDGEQWLPVQAAAGGELPLALDRWCEARFAPLSTTALRLRVAQQDGCASGVLEWQVVAARE
ncbi:MAG: glycoside hydrolase family 127 protein [Planctomycetota bacterium]